MFSTYGHASFVTTYAQAVHIKSADMFSALRGRTYCTAPARRIAGTGIDGLCQCTSNLSVARSHGAKKKWHGRFQALGVKLLYVFTPMLRPLSSTTGVFKINAHIPLLLFVLLPPIPNYNVDDFVLRGAGRRRVSDYFAAACTQHFHVQLCEGGKGGGLQHI